MIPWKNDLPDFSPGCRNCNSAKDGKYPHKYGPKCSRCINNIKLLKNLWSGICWQCGEKIDIKDHKPSGLCAKCWAEYQKWKADQPIQQKSLDTLPADDNGVEDVEPDCFGTLRCPDKMTLEDCEYYEACETEHNARCELDSIQGADELRQKEEADASASVQDGEGPEQDAGVPEDRDSETPPGEDS